MPSTDDLEYAYYVSLFGDAATSGLTLQDLRYKYYYMALQGTLPGGGGGGGWTAVDATPTVKGIIKLAGSLAGTADAPSVPGLATKSSIGHVHAASDVTSGVFPPARIATGTPDGTKFLRDDQVWAAPPAGGGGGGGTPVTPGSVHFLVPTNAAITTLTAGWIHAFPVELPALTITQLTLEVSTGAAGRSVMCGIYQATTPGGIGTLAADFGTVGADTSGIKTFTGSWAVTAGLYYLGVLTGGGDVAFFAGGLTEGGLARFPLIISPTAYGGKWLINGGNGGLVLSPTVTPMNPGGVGTAVFPWMTVKVA